MAKVIITGAAGFVGAHLSERCIKLGHEVVAIDSLKYGSKANLPDHPALTFHKADLADLSKQQMAEMLSGTSVLFHLAAEKLHNAGDDTEAILGANFAATHRLFEAAGMAGVPKVVFTSSLYAYGPIYDQVMSEDLIPAPHTLYGISKLAGEHMLFSSQRTYGFKALAFRLFFLYGTKQYAGLGYPSVIVRNFSRILSGKPPVILGDGLQSLDYVYVDDAVDAMLAGVEGGHHQLLVNVSCGEAVTIKALTQLMCEVSGYRGPIIHAAPDWTQGTMRCGAPNRIKSILGWTAKVPIRQGIDAVYASLSDGSTTKMA